MMLQSRTLTIRITRQESRSIKLSGAVCISFLLRCFNIPNVLILALLGLNKIVPGILRIGLVCI